VPQGQFGTRLQGGKDSASPRYIHTYLQPGIRRIVPEADFPILTYRDDDGLPVEPEFYAPILPMLLVNGARGIGTGYSTFIPPCNPRYLRTMLMSWLSGIKDALDETISVYYEGFKGTVRDDGTVQGVYTKEKDGSFRVTELPPGTWTQDYREFLEKELAEGRIKDFVDVSTDTQVNILIKGMDEAALVKSLTDKVKLTNMHAFNAKGQITKYTTLNAILKEFAEVRLTLYETRRTHQIAALESELPYHENVMRFIDDQCLDTPTVVLRKKTRAECDGILEANRYAQIDGGYDYILRLPVSSFTAEQSAKHRTKLADLRKEIATLKATTARAMWLSELSAL
jgi:DNA topoisomerase-2